MTPVLIKPDGTVEELPPENGTDFTFEELYPTLECTTIEIIYLFDGTMMLFDEEHSFKKDPATNAKATHIALTALKKTGRTVRNTIQGNVLHCDTEHIQ